MDAQALLGLDPLPLAFDETDGAHRRVKRGAGQPHHPVERLVARGVGDLLAFERVQAHCLFQLAALVGLGHGAILRRTRLLPR